MKFSVAAVSLLMAFTGLSAQNIVTRNDSIVVIEKGDTLKLPWASGINSAHISEIDFNFDGLKDLFVFESNTEANWTSGDKILPFINIGTPGKADYRYAPEYRLGFPVLEEYVLLRDYNCDGKADIFTRDVRQRMTVYKNISTSSQPNKFKLMTRVLKTDTVGMPYNPSYFHYGEVFWGYPDLPSIEDIDGDGDLDILNSPVNPHFIEYNKNMSMEKYGTCDSLDFKVMNTCWGHFLEDTGTVTLNMCDVINVPNPEGGSTTGEKGGGRHSHDAMLAIDLDGDGDKDILEGDAARTTLYSFINGGKKDSSYITSFTEAWPSKDTVDIFNYAHPFYVDVNNDNKKDLIVSVGYDILKDTGSVWMYKNVGTTAKPVFELQSTSFLQGEMIDVGTRSKPVFFDYNQDGLMDLVVGNHGYFEQYNYVWANSLYRCRLSLYKNIGTNQQPVFELVDENFAHLDTIKLNLNNNTTVRSLHPTFGDLDGDGDEDMFLGDHRGRLHYFENIPVNSEAEFHLVSPEFMKIDVGDFATPQLFDIDGDEKLDLMIGEADGTFNYYKNSTTTSLNFTLMDDTFGDVNVKDDWDIVGYSSPFFFRDSTGNIKMISGSKPGFFRYYDSISIGDTLSAKFKRVEYSYQEIWDGIYSSFHGADVDGDGHLDFITGNQSGGVSIYTSEDSIYIPGFIKYKARQVETEIFPNPARNEITLRIKCSCPDQFDFTVYDVMGKEVANFRSGAKITFDVSGYKSGLYVVKGQNKNRSIVITERFFKIN